MRFVRDGDMELISQKLDFLGINYYSEHTISYDEKAPYLFCVVPSWQECTDIGWPVTPYGLLHVLRYFSKKRRERSCSLRKTAHRTQQAPL